jgi:YbgC/YbaW family acyl-CoA thioester hydrolase
MPVVYVHRQRVRLARTDAGGVVFFVEPLVMAHEAYEALLDEVGVSARSVIDAGCGIPIVDARVSLRAPLKVGDDVDVTLRVTRLGGKSFTIAATLSRGAEVVGEATTTHVFIEHGQSAPLPAALRVGLAPYVTEPS